MNFISQNVKGLNDLLNQKAIVSRIRSLNYSLVCLIETRVKENKNLSIVDRLFNGWGLLHNYSFVSDGIIWILWASTLQVDLIASTDQCITCSVFFLF